MKPKQKIVAKRLRSVAIWLSSSAIALIVLSFLLPLTFPHAGEQQMIDAPGVLYKGVCCIEAPWHFFQHLIWFPIAPVLLLFGIIAAISSAMLKW